MNGEATYVRVTHVILERKAVSRWLKLFFFFF